MKINALCDVDGILASFYEAFADYLNKTYDAGLNIHTEPANYSFKDWGPKLKNVNLDKATVNWIKQHGFLKVPVYENAQNFIENLNKICNVFIVTARVGDYKQYFDKNVINTIMNDTASWFKNNNFPDNKIIFEHKKIDFCKENSIPILIEDKLETVLAGAKEGIHCILLNRAWNQHPERFKIYRAYNYEDILKIIRKLGG